MTPLIGPTSAGPGISSTSLSIDFETGSEVDLRKAGVHAYARHPSTRVLCLSFKFQGEPTLNWRPGQAFPQRVIDHVLRGGRVQGWNVTFEWVIWNIVLVRQVPELPELSLAQLSDTMARAAYWGLPLGLDQVGKALGLGVVKDAAGHKLMMQMNKPRKRGDANTPSTWWHETDPAKLDRLVAYCDTDVEVEVAVGELIPELPEEEQATWQLDARINARGVTLDTALVDRLQEVATEAKGDADAYMEQLTEGEVKSVTSTAAMLGFLKGIGYPHDDLTKDSVSRRLADDDLTPLEREVLEVRQDAAKTSTAKLKAMMNAASLDDEGNTRVRGMLQFYGAFRTGRWAGRLVQLQNLPRGTVKKVDEAIQCVLNGMPLDMLECFFGPALGLVSSALRGCLKASPGHTLAVADFAQIEARVVAWLAGQHDILDVFARGEDVYVYTAKKNGSTDRQLGKVLVLACGFGMSAPKFKDTARTYKLTLTDEQADLAVKGWRRANSKIVQFWYDCDTAAKAAIRTADENGNSAPIHVGPVQFAMWRGHLLIRLPSGRKLVYRDAALMPGRFSPESITYMGVDQYTRQWKRQHTYGGKLVENITQAVARDIMRDATLAADRLGIAVELLVHDEMVCEVPGGVPEAQAVLDKLLAIMRTPPAWAKGLPVDGAGWVGARYKK